MKNIFRSMILAGSILICIFSFIACGNQLTLEGYLIDKHCSEMKSGKDETVKCLQMKECEANGYGLDVFENDTKKFIKFDENGQTLAKNFIEDNCDKETLGKVSVNGKYNKDLFVVYSIKFKD